MWPSRPGSIWGTKRWPYYRELATELAGRTAVVVVGGPDDAELGEAIRDAVTRAGGRALNACGKATVRQSAALIARARLLVTNDSAPLHFATPLGTPVVALFGPTVPEFGFGPVGDGDLALGVTGSSCRPCSAHGPARVPARTSSLHAGRCSVASVAARPSRRPVRYVVGIDLGGTNIVVGTVAEDGSELVGLVSEPTLAEQGSDAVVARIVKLARALHRGGARETEIAGVGIGSPGPLDTERAARAAHAEPRLDELPACATASRRRSDFPPRSTTTPTARCSASGGAARRAARSTSSGLTIGTGIGGGIVLHGEIYHGASDIAGRSAT